MAAVVFWLEMWAVSVRYTIAVIIEVFQFELSVTACIDVDHVPRTAQMGWNELP